MMNLGKPFTSKISDDLKEPMVHVGPFPHGIAPYWGKKLNQQLLECDTYTRNSDTNFLHDM